MAQVFYFLGDEQLQPEVLAQHAVLAEEAGFDGVCISEHFHPWVADQGSGGFALSTLAAVAVKTSKVKLMTGVISPLFRYHPAVVAQAAATIDRLSGGRCILGVGTGESINETPLGYNYPAYKERSERMKEAMHIMKRLLSGEKISFDGMFYKTHDAKLYSPPIHPVPIFLAAGGTKSANIAGEFADGVIVSVKNPEDALQNIILPAKEKRTNKKDFVIVASRWSIFAQDEDAAWQALLPWRGLRAPHRDTATDPEELQKEADSLPKNEILSRYTVVSSAEEYIATYLPLIETLRADIVIIQTASTNPEATIGFLGKHVLPRLKSL